MTGQPNQKKLKTDSEFQSDATVILTSANPDKTSISSQKSIPGAIPSEDVLFIEEQGESSVEKKLNRDVRVLDNIVLLKDFPDENLYKGYLCTITSKSVLGQKGDDTYYEINFLSIFDEDDHSRKSKKRNPEFEFPTTNYTMVVKGKDFIRLETQDLYYKTCFTNSRFIL